MSQSRFGGTGCGFALTSPLHSLTLNPPRLMTTASHFFSSPLDMILRVRMLVFVPARAEAAECADLKDAAVTFRGIDHGAALGDEARHRLLAHHVLAGLHRGDRNQRVPVRRRGDGDHVDVLAFEHAAEVGVERLVVGAAEPFHVALGELFDV